MKKTLLGLMIIASSITFADTATESTIKEMPNYNYTITYVGEETPKTLLFSFMGEATTNAKGDIDSCSKKLGEHYASSKKDKASTAVTVLPLEKVNGKIKTVLIYEKTYPNPIESNIESFKLTDDCTIDSGASLIAKSTFIEEFELDKETRLTLGNGKEISVKVNQTH